MHFKTYRRDIGEDHNVCWGSWGTGVDGVAVTEG